MSELTPTIQNFVVHWGEMGERWGINRTVAQIQALLFISPKPLNAEQISQMLSIARSTVSVGLHELQNWGIVNVVHKLGDRTDYFELIPDVWEMFRRIADRRVQNELDPTVSLIRGVVDGIGESDDDPYSKEKLVELLEVLGTVSRVYKEFQKVPTKTAVRIAKTSDIITKVFHP
jgi:DNA-binding transcriptional regulator GbsR (MarR family)